MTTYTFSCSKCHRNFTTKVVEGTKVKCNECDHEIVVPIFDDLNLLNLLGFETSGDSQLGLINDLRRYLREPLRKGLKKVSSYVDVDKMILKKLHPWEIYCLCSICEAKYITKDSHEGKPAKCHVCDKEFKIKRITIE